MDFLKIFRNTALIAVVMIFFTACEKEELNQEQIEVEAFLKVKAPTVESAGNNLSFPVIWAEGIPKNLREAPADAVDGLLLGGEWWYVWGDEPIDPASPIYSCEPNPADELLCLDQTELDLSDPGLFKAFVQKDALNFWEAYNASAEAEVYVDLIDWGDNLESIDWTLRSQVRTELVLYKIMPEPVLQYPMRHVTGWGTSEVHGLQTDLDGNIQFQNAPGNQATVYSTHTRMTIQKLNVDRDDPLITQLEWDAVNSKWIDNVEDDVLVINEPLLNQAIHEASDGPGYFNAEVNVKGKIMYGYTWDMKKLNDGSGAYRITYSFDSSAPSSAGLNTFFTENTQIIVPLEEEEEITIESSEGEKGGNGILDVSQNITYMDIIIIEKTGGGGGNGGNNGGNNGGGNGPK